MEILRCKVCGTLKPHCLGRVLGWTTVVLMIAWLWVFSVTFQPEPVAKNITEFEPPSSPPVKFDSEGRVICSPELRVEMDLG